MFICTPFHSLGYFCGHQKTRYSFHQLKKTMKNLFLTFLIGLIAFPIFSQKNDTWADDNFKGIEFRSIGPAFMSGRIADVAIHPNDNNVWYVAVGSGGVWKTENAGVTWTPIFDDQTSYSTGCVTIDSKNPNVVWVGTGENVGGRHVGYGDGIYRSSDGGKTWKNMGLKKSEHISKILINPENSDIIYVAVQGPLWSKGGERGLYMTENGGKDWNRVLGDDEWTGVTDIAMDPRNPKQIYAATWQRHRTVAAYMGGGPKSGLHRSSDGGKTWEKLTSGLPKSNMGKIGLAISTINPDVLYAAIETDRKTGSVYKSTNQGSTWTKGANAVAGGTGPHYYQELYACPHNFDRLYLMGVRIQVSDDGGKTFRRLKEENKHSDNHAMAFRKDDPDYLLIGSDGGLYESFDLAENWRFFDNLPLTQFYKIAVDDTEPFYNIYGGTQDNATEGGPSRTDNIQGIQNSDWRVVLDWDGHQPATEPGNPNIVYAERQEGQISRLDMSTGEIVDIQPQPAVGEGPERFNWDAPILVSPHKPSTIFFASQRVWKSENRGDSWTAISGDLTRNQDRLTLPIMGSTQSWDNPWDVAAMSNYNTITSLAQSPKNENLIYAGTDDGIIQVTEDGGANWRKIEVGSITGVPSTAFVNDIKADLHDANTVYVCLDNHKYGDYKPYVVKSTDGGKTWKSIRSNIPDRTLVWRIVQDHVKPELLFLATEFGIYFTVNGGQKWTKLKGGVPTISFRDLQIQRRENDLVGASFGRSIYVLDDYSVLREVTEENLNEEAALFSTRKAWWYIPRSHLGFYGSKGDQGASHFVAPNPPFGAVFTYHLKDDLKSKKATRKENEKNAVKRKESIAFAGWDALAEENRESEPKIWLTVKDNAGNVVRRIEGSTKKGFHRLAWDLRYPAPDIIDLEKPKSDMSWGGPPRGQLAAPGTYTVTLSKSLNGQTTQLGTPQTFEVVPMREGHLKGAKIEEVAAFWRRYEQAVRQSGAVSLALKNAMTRLKGMDTALKNSRADVGDLDARLHDLRKEIIDINAQLNGDAAKNEIGEKTGPTIGDRLFKVSLGISNSTYGPTETNKKTMEIIESQLSDIRSKVEASQKRILMLGDDLVKAGAPWVEGGVLPK